VDALSVTNNSGEEISHGDNMVWTTIKACMVKGGINSSETTTILIIGADYNARAACHAIQNLGFQSIVIVSGESEKAQAIVMDFREKLIIFLLKTLKDIMKVSIAGHRVVVIGCSEHDLLDQDIIDSASCPSPSLFIELEHTSHSEHFGVVASASQNWKVYTAEYVLRERMYALFEFWTGRNAPKSVMEAAVKPEFAASQVGIAY
jgi:shikimate 5-dehydrogenase